MLEVDMIENPEREQACVDMQILLGYLSRDMREMALALGPEKAGYEIEMIRLSERMWCVQDYKVGALDKAGRTDEKDLPQR